jgi:integrase
MLSTQEIKNIATTGKLQRIYDSELLYLFVSAVGGKTWKVIYRFNGNKNTITLGKSSLLSAKDARLKRDEIKLMLFNGIDPNQIKKDKALQDSQKGMTLEELMLKYIEVEAITRKGGKQEIACIQKIIRDFPKIVAKPLSDISQLDMIEFRNERLKVVKPATVKRDLGLFGGIFKYARQELRIMATSPLVDISKPKESQHRERRISDDEIEQILKEFNYSPTSQPINKKQQAAWAFLFAIETAMRASEITGLLWSNVFDDHVLLPDTKNGTSRKVPLSVKAKDLLEIMRGLNNVSVCTMTNANTLAQYFWQVTTEKLKIEDLRFHDTRHEATTRLARKLPIQDLAKVTGHKDLKTLLGYYNPTATELAGRINQADDSSIIPFKKAR